MALLPQDGLSYLGDTPGTGRRRMARTRSTSLPSVALMQCPPKEFDPRPHPLVHILNPSGVAGWRTLTRGVRRVWPQTRPVGYRQPGEPRGPGPCTRAGAGPTVRAPVVDREDMGWRRPSLESQSRRTRRGFASGRVGPRRPSEPRSAKWSRTGTRRHPLDANYAHLEGTARRGCRSTVSRQTGGRHTANRPAGARLDPRPKAAGIH